jgi:membrane protein implicated in regulation of membrane protease activity
MPSVMWIILIVVIVVVGAMVWARMRRQQAQQRQQALGTDSDVARDFSREREDLRSSNLSADDRAWEAASLQRERGSRQTNPPEA